MGDPVQKNKKRAIRERRWDKIQGEGGSGAPVKCKRNFRPIPAAKERTGRSFRAKITKKKEENFAEKG